MKIYFSPVKRIKVTFPYIKDLNDLYIYIIDFQLSIYLYRGYPFSKPAAKVQIIQYREVIHMIKNVIFAHSKVFVRNNTRL